MQAKPVRNKLTKEEKSWIMYDWANSVYATIMMATLFQIYFTTVVNDHFAANGGQGGTQSGDFWWSIGTTVATVIIAVMAPIAGAFADYKGYRQKLFLFFLFVGLGFTLFCAITQNWVLMLLGYALSHIGFSGSCLIYDSYLPDVTTPERMDKVSGYGFAMGYIGGSTIPFLLCIGLLVGAMAIGIPQSIPIRISIVVTVLWWGLFSIPFLKNVKQKSWIEKPQGSTVKTTFLGIGNTAKKIFRNKGMFFFILAYFFYIDGVGTIINLATAYGSSLGLDMVGMILALLVTQIVAVPCSILFSHLSKRFGSLKMIVFAVVMYLFICIVGFLMGLGVEPLPGSNGQTLFSVQTAQLLFWILAFMVGTVQGGIQALSRSYFGKLVPPENAGEYFGFFEIFGKFAAVLGPLLYALTKGITGSSAFSILSIILLFVAALVILGVGRKHLAQ